MATIWANTALAMATWANRVSSRASLTVAAESPLESAYLVARSPSWLASWFIWVTKALSLPASQVASSVAMLLPEGISIASSSCSSESCSPTTTWTTDWPVARSCWYSATSGAVTVTRGPVSPEVRGWALSTSSAVITLARLPIGSA